MKLPVFNLKDCYRCEPDRIVLALNPCLLGFFVHSMKRFIMTDVVNTLLSQVLSSTDTLKLIYQPIGGRILRCVGVRTSSILDYQENAQLHTVLANPSRNHRKTGACLEKHPTKMSSILASPKLKSPQSHTIIEQ